MRLSKRGGLREVLAVVALVAAAACSRDLAGPPREAADSRAISSYTLPAIDSYTCRYGGSYPACESAPSSLGPEQQSPGTEPYDPASGGSYPPPDSTTNCDPSTDPTCEKALTSTDSATILHAIGQFMRSDSEIADTANRRLCNEMLNQFLQQFQNKLVFRGSYDSQGGDAHYGMTYDGHIHFDPWLLNGAAAGNTSDQRELVNTALHEAGHVIGYMHPREFDSTGHYYDRPFNLLDPGPNVCNR